ncbi:MAG: hypothetical protein ACPGPD_02200 [Pseudomonadales bacterium]
MIENLGHLDKLPTDFPWLQDRKGCVQFEWTHREHYIAGAPVRPLNVLLCNSGAHRQCLITDQPIPLHEAEIPEDQFAAVARALALLPINLDAPMPLVPVTVAKPWGQEVWYTGIEARGVSLIVSTPIAWVIDIFGDAIGCRQAPILLKILDPFTAENLGDLYFELHEEKREVYIVTHVDETAWPDGTGQLRYGFNGNKLAQYPDRTAFQDDYLRAVEAYETTRRSIDGQLRQLKQERGMDPTAPMVPAATLALLAELPPALLEQEAQLRADMYAFTALVPVRTGDVISVAPFVPHSLQHGVRVVEFQTPHYERYILSFGQEVLTQDHWNTREALNQVAMAGTPPVLSESAVSGRERVASFDAFDVERITLKPGESISLAAGCYQLVMGIKGNMLVGETQISAETAWFIPPGIANAVCTNSGDLDAVLLLAAETQTTSRAGMH